jgi:hypothetical protein
MVPMYVLMSVFHASPWLKRFRPASSRDLSTSSH